MVDAIRQLQSTIDKISPSARVPRDIRINKSTPPQTLKFPADADSEENPNGILFTIRDPGKQVFDDSGPSGASDEGRGKSSSAKKLVGKIKDHIYVYMPETINVVSQAQWQEEDIGVIGSEDIIKSLQETLKDNVAKLIGKTTDLNVSAVRNLAQRKAINPHAAVLFRGLEFRVFSVDLKFYAKSEDETILIKKIITTFRKSMTPEIKNTGGGRFFSYPNEFDISIMHKDSENQFISLFDTAALLEMQINSMPDGIATLKNGSPTGITVTLRFKELSLVTRDKIKAVEKNGFFM